MHCFAYTNMVFAHTQTQGRAAPWPIIYKLHISICLVICAYQLSSFSECEDSFSFPPILCFKMPKKKQHDYVWRSSKKNEEQKRISKFNESVSESFQKYDTHTRSRGLCKNVITCRGCETCLRWRRKRRWWRNWETGRERNYNKENDRKWEKMNLA